MQRMFFSLGGQDRQSEGIHGYHLSRGAGQGLVTL